MSDKKNMVMSRIPSKTWYWLDVNEADAMVPEKADASAAQTKTVSESGAAIVAYQFPAGRSDVSYEDKCPAGEKKVIIQTLSGRAKKELYGLSRTKLSVEKGGDLTLVQIFQGNASSLLASHVHVSCAERSHFHLVQLVLGGGRTYIDFQCQLEGDHSKADADLGYLARHDELCDVNYNMIQRGRKTSSRISVSGVLKDKASKTFRGTIDFRKGSAGSVGAEKEDVLLINEGVKNVTVPVILCQEEDVDGTHGASIGKMDEALIFYLMSRGIPQSKIYAMMAWARLSSVTRQIPDPQIRRKIDKKLEALA